jgi:hypothetical protein
MDSLFPGVDPYVESQNYWRDLRHRFITYFREAIADQLPDDYEVWINERPTLPNFETHESSRSLHDVSVHQYVPESPIRHDVSESGPSRPITVPVMIFEEEPQAFLEVFHRPDRSLVAVSEVLLSENKTGAGHVEYLARRNAILRQEIHLVELDFLVGGRRLPMKRPLPLADFYALVARGDRRPECDVYAWTIRDPFPAIRLPLLAPDPDVTIDVAAVYAMAFGRGRYARSINYAAPLMLPIAPADRAWAEERASSGRLGANATDL